jgi:threonine synthase
VVRELWQRVDKEGGFDFTGTAYAANVRESGFVSGMSTHADRIATIRDVERGSGTVVDPHTADGIKVGREFREQGVPLICIETALPAKFAATIREALGRDPQRPPVYADLESRPQYFEQLPADVLRVKALIASHADAAA